MEGGASTHLSLDRDLRARHAKFDSWRLGSGLYCPPYAVELPSCVYTPEVCDTDYVHARNSALFNAVAPLPSGGSALFLQGQGGAAELHTLTADCPPSINRVCSLPPGPELPLVEPALMPTVVEVSTTDGAAVGPQHHIFLVSSGQGDLHLVSVGGGSDSSSAVAPSSPPVYPLRPHAPLQGVRPFQLLAVMRCGAVDGPIVALVWAVARGTADCLSQCELHALTLQEQPDGGLGVQNTQLLQRSALPPFGALCDAASGGVLLALDPLEGDLNAENHAGQAENADKLAGNGKEDEDGDDMSPRTLAAAAARLAHLTSDELLTEADLPGNQYADVFKESGPDGAGALGAEPACSILALRWREDGVLMPTGSISCHPHRLLNCQVVYEEGFNTPKLRLMLTDDVDAAVIEAAAVLGAPGGSFAAEEGQIVGDFRLRHVYSIPALAYVAAGKLQRKFLLAAGAGAGAAATGESAGVAAALIEARHHVYLYRHVGSGQDHGEQAVVDTGLGDGAAVGVAGAALADEGQPWLLVLGRDRLLCYPLL